MSYRHILVAIDLSPNSRKLIDKAILLADALDAKLSLIYVDETAYDAAFSGLIDLDLAAIEPLHPSLKEFANQLKALVADTDYPIENQLVMHGDLSVSLDNTIKHIEADLIVCGHEHSFWHRLASKHHELVNNVSVDLLVIPLDK
ncbi:universal stress protein [Agarivorans sp. MS3-6]